MKQGEWDDHAEAIDHYREGLYRIAMGESNPVDIALTYLGEDRESFKEWLDKRIGPLVYEEM